MTYNTKNLPCLIKKVQFGFIIILAFLLLLTLYSCKKQETITNPIAIGQKDNIYYIINNEGQALSLGQYNEVKPYYDEYLMVKKNNKWGYIKNTGEIVTKFIYDEVYPMKENKALVKDKDTYKIINPQEETLYLFDKGYTSNSYFQNDMLLIEKDGLYGYLIYNEKENLISIGIKPTFDFGGIYSEGFAVVGKITNNYMKYSYINNLGDNIYDDFLFDTADDVSNGRAKVGFEYVSKTYYQYLIMPTEPSTEKTPKYLISSLNNKVVRYEYATSFSNKLAFVANYVNYEHGSASENTLYYKEYSFIDVDGNCAYENGIDDIGKNVPKNFYPYSPFFLNNVLVFFNATRSIPICNVVQETKYKQESSDPNVEYDIIHEFKNASYNISQDSKIVNDLMIEKEWTSQMTIGYLKQPYEIKKAKFEKSLDTYIAAIKIFGDRCSIIKIVSTKIPETENKRDSLDEYKISMEYIIPVIYDNIIY